MVNLAQVIYVLGIINVVSGLLILFSCRCLLYTLVGKMQRYGWYRKFYRMHSLYWWIFFASVFLHSMLAFIFFGNPF